MFRNLLITQVKYGMPGVLPETTWISEEIVSVLEVVEEPVEFVDTRNNKRQGKVHLRPAHVVLAGVPFGRPYQAPFAVR